MDLQRFGDALRMRWLWLKRTEESRPWQLLPDDRDPVVEALFHVSTFMELGDGRKALFWEDRWLQGKGLAEIAPCLYAAVSPRDRKQKTVSSALCGDSWISDISGALTVQVILEYLLVWDMTRDIQLTQGDGLLTRCSPQPPPTAPFSLDSTRLMVRGYYAKLVRRRNANSSYGWLFMIGVGRLPEGKNMDSRTTMLVSFAPRHLKLLIIYWSNALFPGICGSISFTGWVGAHSPLMSMIVSSLVGGRR